MPDAPTVLITGSNSGVGEATARLFLERGWNVAATARRPDAIGDWAKRPQAMAIPLDVTSATSIEAAVKAATARFGGIDVLINNAGIGLAGPLEAVTDDQMARLFDVNLFGVHRMIRAVLPSMRVRRSGLIVNVASAAGFAGLPLLSPYCASKFALEGLSEALAYELQPHGVRVKLIEPGGVRTRFQHEWTSAPAYEPQASAIRAKMKAGGAAAAGPEGVAMTILRAVNDPSPRLRYCANGAGPFALMKWILPAGAWRGLVRRAFAASARPAKAAPGESHRP